MNNSDTSTAMPAVLLRLFSTQDSNTQTTMNTDERGEELKKTLGISGKPALSVTELEKQFLQSSTSQQTEKPVSNNENLAKPVPVAIKVLEKKIVFCFVVHIEFDIFQFRVKYKLHLNQYHHML